MSFNFGALKKRLRGLFFFLNQNVSSPCNDKFLQSCPCWTSTKRKIQRGHKKVTEVTFNLKWLRVQEKQPFWMSMPDRFSSFEFGNLKHCCAKWHWGFPFTSVFCSLNLLLLSLHALHPFLPQGGVSACNSGKLLKIEEDASHGSLIMELLSWGGDKCLGHGATCIVQFLTPLVVFLTLPSQHWILWTLHQTKGRKEISETDHMPKEKSTFW